MRKKKKEIRVNTSQQFYDFAVSLKALFKGTKKTVKKGNREVGETKVTCWFKKPDEFSLVSISWKEPDLNKIGDPFELIFEKDIALIHIEQNDKSVTLTLPHGLVINIVKYKKENLINCENALMAAKEELNNAL